MITFDQEKTAFFHEVGRALCQWALLEEEMFAILFACIPSPESASLYSAYLAVENFRSKLKMIDNALAEKRKDDSVSEHWTRISARINSEAVVRNKIAHWAPMSFPKARAGRRYGMINKASVLLPYYRKGLPENFFVDPKPPKDGIFVREVMHSRARWFALSQDVHEVWLYLVNSGGSARLPTTAQQPPKPPDLQQILSQIRSRVAPREKSSGD